MLLPVFFGKTNGVLLNLQMVKLKKKSRKNVIGGQKGEERCLSLKFFFSYPIREQEDHLSWIFPDLHISNANMRFYEQTKLYIRQLYIPKPSKCV